MPAISVIVPVYNSAKTLCRCVDSILQQTFSNFELLLIDDGSCDESLALMARYAASDRRVRIFFAPHKGVSAARNLGIANSRGRYLQFVDSDDYVEADMLFKLRKLLLTHHADIAVCNYTHPSIENTLGDCVLDLTDDKDFLTYYQSTFAEVVPWNKLYRRSVIAEPFDETVHFCEDALFGLANAAGAKRLVSTSEKLYHYEVAPVGTPVEQLSCITRIALAPDFWTTKETYWYKMRALLPAHRDILSRRFGKRSAIVPDILYSRLYDFMLWELIIFSELGVNTEGLLIEMKNIFREPEFRRALRRKGQHGLRFHLSEEAVAPFLFLSRKALADCRKNHPDFSGFRVVQSLFFRFFAKAEQVTQNAIDLTARDALLNEKNLTPEAVYTALLCREDLLSQKSG